MLNRSKNTDVLFQINRQKSSKMPIILYCESLSNSESQLI